MPFEYYAENHDWDLTLRASWNLLMAGQVAKNSNEMQFSCFTGAMLLSFCAVESFMNSTAFSMSRDKKYENFEYSEYNRRRRFWDRLEMICGELEIPINKAKGIFHTIEEMRKWRNSLVHTSPYSIELTTIVDTKDSKELHRKFKNKEYTKSMEVKLAKKYYKSALDFVDLIKNASGFEPRAMCSYKVL